LLRDELEAIKANKPSFAKSLPAGTEKGVRWVEPRLVCEIDLPRLDRRTDCSDGGLQGSADDKSAEESFWSAFETITPRALPDREGIRLTTPKKFSGEGGITKQGLADFYADIADWIFPQCPAVL